MTIATITVTEENVAVTDGETVTTITVIDGISQGGIDSTIATHDVSGAAHADIRALITASDTLAEMTDVTITSLAANEIIGSADGSTFVNRTLSEAGIAPLASPTFTGTVQAAALDVTGTLSTPSIADLEAEVLDLMTRPILEGGLTELVGINEQVDQNDYSASVGVALGATYSGEILNIGLYSTEDGTGAVQTPAGTVLVFDVDPAIASGDTSITAAEWTTVIGKIDVAATDWLADANGGMAYLSTIPIAFHALSTIYFAWFHTDATSLNSAAGDDEQIEFNFWYRRDS